jgi:outer membrane protein assembly factor BamB
VLAAAHGSEIRLTALAADDGSELWSRRDVDGALAPVGVLGDTALFLSSPTRGADDLVALDVRTGIERWRRPQPTPDSAVFVDEHHLIVTRMAGGGLVGVDLLDPGDGSVRASIDGPGMQINRTEVVTRAGDTFAVYDLDTFERIAHVTVPVLRGAPAAVTVTPHGLIVVTTDRARLVDDDGRVVAGVGLNAAASPGVSGAFAFEGHVATLVGATLTVLRVDDDGLHTAWSRDADVLHATSGDRPLLALVPAGTYGGAPGRDPIDVVDAATGRAVWSGRVPSPGDGPILTRSGFLAAGSAGVISGIDPSGRTMWTLPTTGSPTIGVGALLEVRPTAGDATSSTVTLLR